MSPFPADRFWQWMPGDNDHLSALAVMWADGDHVRATYFANKPVGGYGFLIPGDTLCDKTIQRVAGCGMYLSDALKKKWFPGKHNWSR